MPLTTIAALTATMVATAFLSGIFGMAGGMILMGVLLALLSVPEAMALHGLTQMAADGWRGLLWHSYVDWRSAGHFLAGSALAFLLWSAWRYVPSKSLAFVLLGLSPFIVRAFPTSWRPDPGRWTHGLAYGGGAMSLMLMAGVSGPLIDTFFLGGRLDRRQIVATKAVCQIASHGAKLVYFGGLVEGASSVDPLLAGAAIFASVLGTSLARPILDRLTEAQYRWWASRIVVTIASIYLLRGIYLFFGPTPGGPQ